MNINMNLFEAIDARYSHKEEFLPDPVPLLDLERIAKAGITAPSGVNRQTVRLIILPNRERIDPFSQLTPHGGLATAPAAIALLTDSTPHDWGSFEKEDYSAAMQNILLAATALGYSSLWLDSPYFDAAKEAAAKKLLAVPENYRLWAMIPIGKPKGAGTRREKLPFEARVFYGLFGGSKASL